MEDFTFSQKFEKMQVIKGLLLEIGMDLNEILEAQMVSEWIAKARIEYNDLQDKVDVLTKQYAQIKCATRLTKLKVFVCAGCEQGSVLSDDEEKTWACYLCHRYGQVVDNFNIVRDWRLERKDCLNEFKAK